MMSLVVGCTGVSVPVGVDEFFVMVESEWVRIEHDFAFSGPFIIFFSTIVFLLFVWGPWGLGDELTPPVGGGGVE